MENTERLFLGLHLDALFQKEIAARAETLCAIYPDQKWVNLRHFHFTIHFLGDTASEKKEKVALMARDIASQIKPFPIALEGMGAFPSLQKPRVIWVGAAKSCREDLVELYDAVTRPLIEVGFPVEHATFTPHATLFRVRADSPIAWNEWIFSFPKTDVRYIGQLTLFKSVSSSDGPEYQPVEAYPFSKSM